MVNLLFIEDDDLLRKPGVVKTLFDPAWLAARGFAIDPARSALRAAHSPPAA